MLQFRPRVPVLARGYRTRAAPLLYSPLDSTRSLLSIQGADSTKFLQGLVSNDVRKLERGPPVIYAALLQADGRYMSDVFLHRHPSPLDPSVASYLVDHPTRQTSQLRSYLKRHILRSKLKLGKEAERDWFVVQAWRNPGSSPSDRQEFETAQEWLESRGNEIARDPRVAGMGWRWIANKQQLEQLPPELFQLSTPSHYHLHRLSYSVPENPSDFPALPLEANLELLNGVDYKKGCYVGQELTARTHFKGVVRKRGVGIRLFREGEDVPTSFLPPPPPDSTTERSNSLIPSPNLYPTPLPGSILTPFVPSSSSSSSSSSSDDLSTSTTPTNPRTTRRRGGTVRPAGKLGSTLPLVNSSNGAAETLTIGFGSVKLDQLDQVFTVSPPPRPTTTTGGEAEKKKKEEEEEEQGGEEGQGGLEGGGGEEEGKWFAKGFLNEWVEFKLEEQEISKGLS